MSTVNKDTTREHCQKEHDLGAFSLQVGAKQGNTVNKKLPGSKTREHCQGNQNKIRSKTREQCEQEHNQLALSEGSTAREHC